MFASYSKHPWVNVFLLFVTLFLSAVSFMLYTIYIIREIALHDVYYDLYLYQSTLFFMIVSLYSLGFFILPFLHTLTGSVSQKQLLFYTFGIQLVSLILLYFFLTFLVMLLSVIAMSLYNAAFVLLCINIWRITPKKWRFLMLALINGIVASIITTAFKLSFVVLEAEDLSTHSLLIVSSIFCAINLFLVFLASFPRSLKRPIKRISDHLFINIFHLVKHYKAFVRLLILVIIIYVFYISIDAANIHWFILTYESLSIYQMSIVTIFAFIILILFGILVTQTRRTHLAIGFFFIATCLISGAFYWLSYYDITNTLTIQLFYFTYEILSLISYSFIIAACIDRLFSAFPNNRVFTFSVFYLLSNIFIWILLQFVSRLL